MLIWSVQLRRNADGRRHPCMFRQIRDWPLWLGNYFSFIGSKYSRMDRVKMFFFYGWDNTNLTFFYRLDEHIPVGFAILFLSSFFFFFWNGLLASCPWESLLGVEKTQKHAFFTWTCCAVWSYIYFLLSN